MVMTTEKKIALSTSTAATRMRCSLSPSAASLSANTARVRCARWRKTFSTMITVASTMMPRSMAPIESRLADSPRNTVIMTASSSATGIVAATISAERKVPRNSH